MHADHLVFCHKYGMTTLSMAFEAGLKQPLEDLLTWYCSHESLDKILDFAEVADACGCSEVSQLCEAFVASHIESTQKELLSSKLSKASLCR